MKRESGKQEAGEKRRESLETKLRKWQCQGQESLFEDEDLMTPEIRATRVRK